MNEQRQLKPIDEVRQVLTSTAMRNEIKKALPEHVSVERFERVVITAIQTAAASGSDLLTCDRGSLWAACMKAAQSGLLPDGREAALVPFKGKVQFMPMVEGLMKHVRNSGELLNLSVQIVRENDEFEYELGDNERIVHKLPKLGVNRGNVVGAYSVATLKGGEKSREVMDVNEIDGIRARSRSGESGPWKTDYAEMCKKTVFRRHYKRLPKSTDLDGMIREDDELFGVAPDKPSPPAVQDIGISDAPVERPSRLQKVVDMEPVSSETVVDVTAKAVQQATRPDSPI